MYGSLGIRNKYTNKSRRVAQYKEQVHYCRRKPNLFVKNQAQETRSYECQNQLIKQDHYSNKTNGVISKKVVE